MAEKQIPVSTTVIYRGNDLEDRAAIVTRVYKDGSANLAIFSEDGQLSTKGHVPYSAEVKAGTFALASDEDSSSSSGKKSKKG